MGTATTGGLSFGMPSHLFEFDFPEFEIGTAERDDTATGLTVLSFPAGARMCADLRGGSVTGRELALGEITHPTGRLDALVFSGGGAAGLEGAAGVAAALWEDPAGPAPRVPALAIDDGTGRPGLPGPDAALGRAALDAARPGRCRVGRAGAGAGARVGSWFGVEHSTDSGQGAAFFQWAGLRVFALSVVHALGNVVDDTGAIVSGVQRAGGGYDAVLERLGRQLAAQEKRSLPPGSSSGGAPPSGHTTLTALVTNVTLERADLYRLAVMAHAATARVIDPIHAPEDGDAVVAISTHSHRVPHDLRVGDLGVLCGHVVREAILTAVRASR